MLHDFVFYYIIFIVIIIMKCSFIAFQIPDYFVSFRQNNL